MNNLTSPAPAARVPWCRLPGCGRLAAGALLGLALLQSLVRPHAQVATYHFTGTVQAAQEPGDTFVSPVSPYPGLAAQVGDKVTGKFSFNTLPGVDLYPLLTNVAAFHDRRAAIEIQLNGHALATSPFYVEVGDNDAAYGGLDHFFILSLSGSLLDNGQRVEAADGSALFSLIRFADRTQTVFTNATLPAALKLDAFGTAIGRIYAGGTNRGGIEFALDSIQRVHELRTGRFVAWPSDAPMSLEVSDRVDGGYAPFTGAIHSFPGEYVAEMEPTGPAIFYRLAPVHSATMALDNFDGQAPGTAPDIGTPVGEWTFPSNYVAGGTAEPDAAVFSIALSPGQEPAGTGHSLRIGTDQLVNAHLPALLPRAVDELTTSRALVRFDIYVPAGARAGCAVYVGGDHGGGGWDSLTDRGPQLGFSSGNTVVAYEVGGAPRSLGAYARDSWHTVELDIDLETDRYDVAFGPRGGALTALASAVQFRSSSLRFIDRFTVAAFVIESQWLAYVDNVTLTPMP